MQLNLLKRLINDNECPIALRREFLQFHSNFPTLRKKEIETISIRNDEELLESLYSHTNGLIFGEEHFDDLSASFLTKNMRYLSQLNVKTLFFEGLHYGLERGLDGNRDEKDSAHEEYGALIDAARMNNIQVVGIDGKACKRGEGITRDIFMNIYAQNIINGMKNNDKWLALVGMMHLNSSVYINPLTFERHAVLGLSDLTGGRSIILDSIDDSEERYIKQNSQFFLSLAKSVATDFIAGVPYKKEHPTMRKEVLNINHFDDICETLTEMGITITYYDIDNFARHNKQSNEYQKGVVFSFSFNELPPRPLEAYKYDIKAALIPSEKHWLEIKTNALLNEMIFCCHFDIAGDLLDVTRGILDRSRAVA
jgi:hypothetical protein